MGSASVKSPGKSGLIFDHILKGSCRRVERQGPRCIISRGRRMIYTIPSVAPWEVRLYSKQKANANDTFVVASESASVPIRPTSSPRPNPKIPQKHHNNCRLQQHHSPPPLEVTSNPSSSKSNPPLLAPVTKCECWKVSLPNRTRVSVRLGY